MRKKFLIFALVGLSLLIASLIAAMVLVRQRQDLREEAQTTEKWECYFCHGYHQEGCSMSHPDCFKKTKQKQPDFYLEEYRCTTYQCDAGPGRFSVGYIGAVRIDNDGNFIHCKKGKGDCPANPEQLGTLPEWNCTPPTATPTPTPTYSCQCTNVRMYDSSWNPITNYSSLSPGDQVYLTVSGTTDHPQGLTRGRIRVNGAAWQETTERHNGEFYISFTIPDYGHYEVEGQVYNQAFGWR